uniref:OTU-like cysteine protease, putative n=1 Tax=Theileria annulata TaxID=5874 RepID=A0A3B0N142_THEAN
MNFYKDEQIFLIFIFNVFVEVDVGKQEYEELQDKLRELGLKIHDIQPDGNCLFKSIEHQLKYYSENGYNLPKYNYMELRRLIVDHLKSSQNEYESFLAVNNTSDSPSINYLTYCENMLKDGEWGSELEIIVLTKLLNCNIKIHNSYNTIEYNSPNNSGATLNISYHKHQYLLGEHYNSIIPI